MLRSERFQEITDILDRNSSIKVSKLAELIHVSPATLRRDLVAMEKQGLVKREYGGVMLAHCADNPRLPFYLREQDNREEKKQIAALAIKEVKENSVIFLDGSSISHLMLHSLVNFKQLTIVSNSVSLCYQLVESGMNVYCIGGRLAFKDYIFVGSYAEQIVAQMRFDTLFFSSSGLTPEGQITGYLEPSVSFLKKAMKQADRSVYLVDASRIGRTSMHTICDVANVDKIICNKPLPKTILDRIGKNRTK